MRGAGLSSQEEGQEGLCRPNSKGLLSQEAAWAKQARQEPPSRDCGKGRGQACAPGAAAVGPCERLLHLERRFSSVGQVRRTVSGTEQLQWLM